MIHIFYTIVDNLPSQNLIPSIGNSFLLLKVPAIEVIVFHFYLLDPAPTSKLN